MVHYLKEQKNMKILLEESTLAFTITMETGGGNNTDFADYTSNNFIKCFRNALQRPNLSRAQLASMLRTAERRRKHRDNDDQWSTTMAYMIAKGANNNLESVN